jgi:hypothetical protein
MGGMSHTGMPPWGHGHAVSWYELDSDGIEAVARFVAHGWAQSESALVIAGAAHAEQIDDALAELGASPEAMRAQGRYVALGVEEVLHRFFHDDVLDAEQFRAVVASLLAEASSAGSHVRVYSELIALLSQQDHLSAALELELQWRSLLREHDFSLLCAYPARDVDDSRFVDVRRVCDLHTDLVVAGTQAAAASAATHEPTPGADGPHAADAPEDSDAPVAVGRYHACSRVYLPVSASVPAARHFVVDVLRAWGLGDLDADAAIIVSELATNAVRHADSPFRVVLDRQLDGVRIGVEDAGRDALARRSPDSYDLGGRGVDIVEALSRRWGSTDLPSGKLVWAELVETVGAAASSEAG